MRRYSTVTAFLVLATLTANAHAENIWKWVDAHGVPHYSDRPVPGAVLIKSLAAAPNAAAAPSNNSSQLAQASAQITAKLNREEARREVLKDEAADRAKLCKKAKARYTRLLEARRIYTVNAKGERHYLSNAAAQKDRVQARLDVQTYCDSNSN